MSKNIICPLCKRKVAACIINLHSQFEHNCPYVPAAPPPVAGSKTGHHKGRKQASPPPEQPPRKRVTICPVCSSKIISLRQHLIDGHKFSPWDTLLPRNPKIQGPPTQSWHDYVTKLRKRADAINERYITQPSRLKKMLKPSCADCGAPITEPEYDLCPTCRQKRAAKGAPSYISPKPPGDQIPRCACGSPVVPGHDLCYACMNQ